MVLDSLLRSGGGLGVVGRNTSREPPAFAEPAQISTTLPFSKTLEMGQITTGNSTSGRLTLNTAPAAAAGASPQKRPPSPKAAKLSQQPPKAASIDITLPPSAAPPPQPRSGIGRLGRHHGPQSLAPSTADPGLVTTGSHVRAHAARPASRPPFSCPPTTPVKANLFEPPPPAPSSSPEAVRGVGARRAQSSLETLGINPCSPTGTSASAPQALPPDEPQPSEQEAVARLGFLDDEEAKRRASIDASGEQWVVAPWTAADGGFGQSRSPTHFGSPRWEVRHHMAGGASSGHYRPGAMHASGQQQGTGRVMTAGFTDRPPPRGPALTGFGDETQMGALPSSRRPPRPMTSGDVTATAASELPAAEASPGTHMQRQKEYQHTLDRHRQQWQDQWRYEQALQREPGKVHKHPKPPNSLVHPFHSTMTGGDHADDDDPSSPHSPLLFTGQPIWLPGPTTGIAKLGAEMGSVRARNRDDAGRWPPSQIVAGVTEATEYPLLSPRAHIMEGMVAPAGAASAGDRALGVSATRAEPSTPSGIAARANARFLGHQIVRALTPRANIDQPPNPPMVSEDTPDQNVYLEALPAPETVGSYLFGSTKRLDSFLGGGMVTVPLVGQAPVFDPRTVKALPSSNWGGYDLAKRAATASNGKKRESFALGGGMKPHTAEFFYMTKSKPPSSMSPRRRSASVSK